MRRALPIRLATALGAFLCLALQCPAASAQSAPSTPVVIDRVVAVVNNRPILLSDLNDEMRLSVLEPGTTGDKPDPRSALERLVSRTLIQQQIRREEEQAADPSAKQVSDRIQELRRQLPACLRADCASNAGWDRFLTENGLTQDEVNAYMRLRLEILNFIEDRFQQGIRISQEEIENYYNKTLLPQYPAGQPKPTLESVSHRIEEVLLQEKVNTLFGAWLDNLRRQGDVEILDPALESPNLPSSNDEGGA
jgi:peptidyl-prolyl cis-trans isomerase SurA